MSRFELMVSTGIPKTHQDISPRAFYGPNFVDDNHADVDDRYGSGSLSGAIGRKGNGVANQVDLVSFRSLGRNGIGTSSSTSGWVGGTAVQARGGPFSASLVFVLMSIQIYLFHATPDGVPIDN
ncbi:hypothetical protein [Kribbella sp. NBC_00359]|uniref:hypothetical protein n=1 Tax=Kribbella sp. NBC_00359 TaxID=2975966 RepID=UPI002E2088A4